jgi:ABC-type multidrug transport system fused ATPase/permease subunit
MNIDKKPLFEPVDLSLNPGERIAIIDGNDRGKSILLHLLSGLTNPDSGKVTLGGQEIDKQNWLDVRRTFAMISPELPLLRGSLRLNLTYGASHISEEEIKRVVHLCGLMPLVERLHKRLDTRISECGTGLSSGERTRIAIARALLAKPSVLLLDETEASLDNLARRALNMVIERFDGTVIYITQDAARAVKADRILAIDEDRFIPMTPTEPPSCGVKDSLKLVS